MKDTLTFIVFMVIVSIIIGMGIFEGIQDEKEKTSILQQIKTNERQLIDHFVTSTKSSHKYIIVYRDSENNVQELELTVGEYYDLIQN